MMTNPSVDNCIALFDLNWDDILIPKITPYLSIKDLFNLRSCSQTAKALVEASLVKRKEINLSGNNSYHIALGFKVLSHFCQRVEKLQLARCHWVTDESLLPMLANNNQLRVVNLNGCINITPLALQPIIIKCKELRVLKLSKCPWLTTGAIDALTLHQSKLVEFDISYCDAIGERCLIIFFCKLNRLTILSLAHTTNVTDQVLIQIGNYCAELEHINLVGCTAISDYGIHAISLKCKYLQSLLIRCCPRVTERTLAPLRRRIYIDRPQNQYEYILNDFYPSDFLIY